MKRFSKILAVLAVLALVGAVQAADDGGGKKHDKAAARAAKAAGLRGQVVKVDGANLVIRKREGKEWKEVTVATDTNTQVTIDGKPAQLSDLKAKLNVTITPTEGTAQKIDAVTPAPKKPKGEAPAAPAEGGQQ